VRTVLVRGGWVDVVVLIVLGPVPCGYRRD
jgi:hypothetical protein